MPAWARDVFDADLPGSLTHFYDVMSFGQLTVSGQVLSRRYVSRLPKKAYLATGKGWRWRPRMFQRQDVREGMEDHEDTHLTVLSTRIVSR